MLSTFEYIGINSKVCITIYRQSVPTKVGVIIVEQNQELHKVVQKIVEHSYNHVGATFAMSLQMRVVC